MRADDSVSGAGPCEFGDASRRVARDGARNHRRHDDANSLHLKSILISFHLLFRHTCKRPARDLNNETACVCNCAIRIRDAVAIADSTDFRLFVATRYWSLQ